MATATAINRAGGEIKLEPNVPQVFALKFVTGKNCGEARFPPYGPRVLFTAVDDRKLWMGAEEASELEHGMLELGIQPADFVRVTRVSHGRGGGYSIRVENAEPAAPRQPVRDAEDPRTIALLEKSLEIEREKRRAAETREAAPLRTASQSPQKKDGADSVSTTTQQTNGTPAVVITPASAKMCAAMCAAVDAILEVQAYATRRGLGLTFSEESVRAIGLSIYIGAQREGGR
jgi:hypothetical protein